MPWAVKDALRRVGSDSGSSRGDWRNSGPVCEGIEDAREDRFPGVFFFLYTMIGPAMVWNNTPGDPPR
jgi:hypothetical protein